MIFESAVDIEESDPERLVELTVLVEFAEAAALEEFV